MRSADLPPEFAAALADARVHVAPLASTVVYFHEVGSTNDLAASLASSGSPEGTVVIAASQTAGRGRLGRVWHSPQHAGLYVSVVLRPSLDIRHASGPDPRSRVPLLALAAGVAVARGIFRSSGLAVELKWPNDVIVRRSALDPAETGRTRKLAGILAEAHTVGMDIQHIVLGYGINLRASAYPPDLAERTTSIEAERGESPDPALVLASTLQELAKEYRDLTRDGGERLLVEWRRWSTLADGAAVQWEDNGAVCEGNTAGIDADGALLVRTATGTSRIVAGTVNWL